MVLTQRCVSSYRGYLCHVRPQWRGESTELRQDLPPESVAPLGKQGRCRVAGQTDDDDIVKSEPN